MINSSQNIKYKIARIKALIRKEFYQIVRDSSSILIAFIYPAILLIIYGVGISLDMNNLKIGLVLQDTNPDAINFYESIKNSKYFSLKVDKDQNKLENLLIAGKIRGLIIVPFYFSKYSNQHYQKGPIYVIADGSETNTANFVQNYIEGAWQKSINQEKINSGNISSLVIDIQPRFWFNETLNSRYFLIPGSIALIMTLIGSLLTALVIAREWERGTIEALMATPVTIREIYLSKTISYFILGMISMVICTIISTAFFGVPFRGSFILLAIVSATFLLTALGTGLLISSLTKNQFLSSQLAITISFMPAFMLSGFVFEISSMPILIRAITRLIPARYMVTCLESLFLVGNVWNLIIINVSVMLLIVFILFFIIFAKPKKRLD